MKDSDIMFEPHRPSKITLNTSHFHQLQKGLFLVENLSVYLFICVCAYVCETFMTVGE